MTNAASEVLHSAVSVLLPKQLDKFYTSEIVTRAENAESREVKGRRGFEDSCSVYLVPQQLRRVTADEFKAEILSVLSLRQLAERSDNQR